MTSATGLARHEVALSGKPIEFEGIRKRFLPERGAHTQVAASAQQFAVLALTRPSTSTNSQQTRRYGTGEAMTR